MTSNAINTKPKIEQKPQLRVISGRRPSTKADPFMKALAKEILTGCAVIFFLAVWLFALNAKNDAMSREIKEIDNNLKIAQAENVRLDNELSMVRSVASVDEWTTSHGMVKPQPYQIFFVDLSRKDKVAVCDGKPVERKSNTNNNYKGETK